MKIRRIRVLMAKGWCKVVCFVSFSLLSLVCNHASAQKAGDMISGRITDDEGPMRYANVCERDSLDRIVAHSVSDAEGRFSFRLVNPNNKIEVTYVGYNRVELPLDKVYYEITMKKMMPSPDEIIHVDTVVDEALTGKVAGYEILFESGDLAYGPPVRSLMEKMDSDEGADVAFSSGKHLIINKPLLVLDGNIMTPDSTAWAGFDITKTDYSKDELARLFGVKARKIKTVTVLKGEAATAVWGMKGWAGVIDVQTKKGYRKMKKTQL